MSRWLRAFYSASRVIPPLPCYYYFMNGHVDMYKAAGILIRDRRLLVERSKGKMFFIAPGGQIEAGETPEEALVRELREEFQITVHPEDFELFGTFLAAAAGQEEKVLEMKVFTVKSWEGEPTPDSEVEELRWVASGNEEHLPLGSIFEHEVIPRLKAADLID